MSLLLCLFVLLSLACGDVIDCSVCEFVVKGAAGLLNNNETESQIESYLAEACTLLPSDLSAECSAFIKQYAPTFFRMLATGSTPEDVCNGIGMCPGTTKTVIQKPVKREVQQIACQICTYVATYVNQFLQQNQTEQEIIQNLEAVCADFGPFAPECDSFVELYTPALIQWILQGESPSTFCTQIGLCNPTVKRTVQQGTCSICQLVATYVEEYVAQNATEAEIAQQLDQLCNLLGPLSGPCIAFVDQYLPQLIQWCINKEPPLQFCTEIGLCTSTSEKRVTQQAPPCSLCELVVTFVDQYLQANATEQLIVDDLDQLCSLLGPLAMPCDAFVKQYVPDLINWIVQGNPPEAFCKSLGLCSTPITKPVIEVKRTVQQAACSVCQLVAQYVEGLVQQNASEAVIEKEIDQLCTLLGPLSGECNSFVAAYLPQLIQWCINKEPPQAFCTQIGLCSAGSSINLDVATLISKLKGH